MKSKNSQSGQALLLVLLAMAVLATMALSVTSRSVSEVAVTTREEESLRAFSAAEAGIEEGLITGSQAEVATGSVPTISRDLQVPSEAGSSTVSTFTAEVDRYPEDLTEFAYPFELLSGQSGTVSFVTRDEEGAILPCGGGAPCFTGNSLTLCWGKPGGAQTPAVLANIIYRNSSGQFAMAPTGFDPDTSRRDIGSPPVAPNNFDQPLSGACNIGTESYRYRANINFASLGISGTPVQMRVAMLYNNSEPNTFGVTTPSNLPVQGRKVSSEGSAGEVTRRINAFLLNPEMPFIFDAAIYSSGDITK